MKYALRSYFWALKKRANIEMLNSIKEAILIAAKRVKPSIMSF
jgi:hypothetical protein